MDHNFDNLTEEQKERVLEFGQVSACCSEDVLEAIEEQIPMTYEMYRKCMQQLGMLGAINSLMDLRGRYPELAARYDKDEGWGPEKKEEDLRKIMEKVRKAEEEQKK